MALFSEFAERTEFCKLVLKGP